MKRTAASLLALTLGLLLLANASAQQTKPVQIVNASFESPKVDEGSFIAGTPGWAWLGWHAASSIVHPGGPSSHEPWPSTPPFGIDGNNFCQLFAYDNGGNGVVYQDTGIKYEAGATYTLTAAFGLQTNTGQRLATDGRIFFDNSGLGESIAWTTISEANLTAGEFKDQSVTYTATGSEAPGDGTYGTPGDVIIGFWLPNSPPQTYMDVDNVRLKVTRSRRPVPPASSAGPKASPTPVPNYFGTHM